MTILSLGLLALLLPPVLFDLFCRPTVRRIGLRNVSRRLQEAALVIGGSMLATALITASMVIGDSFESSIREIAASQLGPTDEIVALDDLETATSAARVLNAQSEATSGGSIDGALGVIRTEVSAGSEFAIEPRLIMLELDVVDAANFGGDPASTGLGGQTTNLSPGEVIINRSTANDLRIAAGDELNVFVNGADYPFVVVEVVPSAGLAGLGDIVAGTGALEESMLSVPGTTLANIAATLEPIAQPLLLVSNAGDVYSGAEQTDAATEAIAAVLGPDVDIDDAKRDLLDDAAAEGTETTQIFGTVGGFSVIAGILLVVNLFVMLAGERKTELGTMRALGVRRGTIVRAFALEGAVYGIVAAALGSLAGIAVGAGVVAYASNSFEAIDGLTLNTSVSILSLVSGAVIGLAISQLTVVVTSLRMTRLNIVRALKDLPEPRPEPRKTRNLVVGLAGLGVSAGLWSIASSSQLGAMLIPSLAAVCLIPVLARFLPARIAGIVGCVTGMAWSASVFGLMSETMLDPAVAVFLLQGVLLVGFGATVVALLDRTWLRVADRVSGGGVAARLGLAHPLARPMRSVMLVSMFALVLFTVTFMGIVNAVFNSQGSEMAQRAGGDYDVLVLANPAAGFSEDELVATDGIGGASLVVHGSLVVGTETNDDNESATEGERNISFVSPGFAEVTPPAAVARQAQFATSEAAWDAVLGAKPGDAELFVMADSDGGYSPGDQVTVRDSSGQGFEATVAGLNELSWMVGAEFYASSSLVDLAPGFEPEQTRFYLQTNGSETATDFAAEFMAKNPERGVYAESFVALAEEALSGQSTFLTMLQGYLILGLVIGVVGLSVVLIRAVRERRRQIGMMRAIGIPASQVRRMFLVEAFFVGAQGVVLGLGLGMLSSWQILANSAAFERDLGFNVPVLWLLGLGIAALALSMLAGIGPAMRAGKEQPAEALRFAG